MAKKEIGQVLEELFQEGVGHLEGARYEEAVEAFRKALTILEENQMQGHPSYASCQGNLGAAYSGLSEVRDREANLGLAIVCYKEALRVRTYEGFPLQYAMTQNNLGNAYSDLSEVRDKEANLGLAIGCYKEALRVRTLESFPQDYAMTQMNLGKTLERLEDYDGAVTSLRKAVKVWEGMPWTRLNLARARQDLGALFIQSRQYEEGEKALKEALMLNPDKRLKSLIYCNLGELAYARWALQG